MASEIRYGEGNADYQQAEWLAQVLNYSWKYDHTEAHWHHFDGIRWAVDKTRQVARVVAEKAADALRDGASTEARRKALLRLFSLAPLEKSLEALSTMENYGTDGSDWDQNPFLLGCANGVIDLRLNQLIKASPEQLVTRSTGVRFTPITGPDDFATVAPKFMAFLLQVTSDHDWTEDPSMVAFLLLWFGASLFGLMPEQRFLILTGSGRNGKGALKHAVMTAIGSEYGIQPDSNLYSRSRIGPARSNEARADLMSLKGRRVAFFSEPDRGQFNEEMLKAHTGGDIITARGLYQRQPISWEPTHSITFLVNDAPSLEDIGPSMGARVMVADFRHRFEGSAEDKRLYQTLAGERAGVLSILCWAAKAWYDQWQEGGAGITLPQRVVEQSKAFMERNDPVAEALRDVFIISPEYTCGGQHAYETYVEWHARSGREDDPISMVKFTTILEKKGFQRYRAALSRGWKGLKPLGAVALAEREGDEPDEDDE